MNVIVTRNLETAAVNIKMRAAGVDVSYGNQQAL